MDKLASRFFAYIALFAAGMIGLILSDNLILFFIFWELMGFCSYLLIGFWFARKYDDPKQITPKEAGLKAFLTTRIGDTIMLAGIFLLYAQTSSLSFVDIFAGDARAAGDDHSQSTAPRRHAVGDRHRHPDLLRRDRQERAVPAARLAAGRDGRSHAGLSADPRGHHGVGGRLPGGPHLPADAGRRTRSGPAVSSPLSAPSRRSFAATIAVAQNDIKRVLAYSTICQLGFMFAALGIGAYVAAIFHLLTHAFFKALLFLGSGSVIHGMEHGHHETAHDTDAGARDMEKSPVTPCTLIAASPSIRKTCAIWAACSGGCRAPSGPSSSVGWR